MGKETIIVDVGPDGEVEVEVHGVQGPGCETLTRDLEASLGRLRDRRKKREYHRVKKPIPHPTQR